MSSLLFFGMAYKCSNLMNALDHEGLGLDTTCNALDQETCVSLRIKTQTCYSFFFKIERLVMYGLAMGGRSPWHEGCSCLSWLGGAKRPAKDREGIHYLQAERPSAVAVEV